MTRVETAVESMTRESAQRLLEKMEQAISIEAELKRCQQHEFNYLKRYQYEYEAESDQFSCYQDLDPYYKEKIRTIGRWPSDEELMELAREVATLSVRAKAHPTSRVTRDSIRPKPKAPDAQKARCPPMRSKWIKERGRWCKLYRPTSGAVNPNHR